jgi:hypothetical protein
MEEEKVKSADDNTQFLAYCDQVLFPYAVQFLELWDRKSVFFGNRKQRFSTAHGVERVG